MSDAPESHLTGHYFVRTLRSAFREADRLLPRRRDRALVWRYARGLRYWPAHHPQEESGRVIDLDWSIVRGLEHQKIYELRINETIGGFDNLRVIFHVGPGSDRFPLTCIWLLAILQKKRNDFSVHQINAFHDLRTLVHKRFYEAGP